MGRKELSPDKNMERDRGEGLSVAREREIFEERIFDERYLKGWRERGKGENVLDDEQRCGM